MGLLLFSCGKGSFTIEGNFPDAGTQNLRFVYVGEDVISSQWIPAVNGKFTMQGSSKRLTVVYIYDARMQFVAHVVVKNGETLLLKGNIRDNYDITVSGSELAERWNAFTRENAGAFRSGNTAKTDAAIAAYVKANPDDVVSTLLLTCDYSRPGSAEAQALLASISEDAKPERLLDLYTSVEAPDKELGKAFKPLKLRNGMDSLVALDTRHAPMTVLYFWRFRDDTRDSLIRGLKRLQRAYSQKDKAVQIADICMMPDTAQWRGIIHVDSTAWLHFRAQGGPTDPTLQSLDIRSANFFIVADSAGTQKYRGSSLKDASSAVAAYMKNFKPKPKPLRKRPVASASEGTVAPTVVPGPVNP